MRAAAFRILLKGMRFEAVAVFLLGLVLFIATVLVAVALRSSGVSDQMAIGWLAAPFADPSSTAVVQRWADLGNSFGTQVLVAAGPYSLAVGLVLGVSLVGRELESGTAELTWSLALSRSAWFVADFLRLTLVVVLVMGVLAVALLWLEQARTASGLWTSPWVDADLYGLPVVTRALMALAVGALFGAVLGRTLPALIVSAVCVVVLTSAISFAQPSFVQQSPAITPGDSSYVAAYIRDPDVDLRFLTRDGRILTREQALASVPAGTDAPWLWLSERYTLVPLGISWAKTTAWQTGVGVLYLAVAAVSILAAARVTARRRPLS